MQLTNNFIKTLSGLIREILKLNNQTDKILHDFLTENRNLKSPEKKIIVDTVYAILRNYFKIVSIIDKKDTLDIIGVTFLKILQLDTSIFEQVNIIDFDKLKKFNFNTDEASTYELPQFLLDKIKGQYPLNYADIINSLNERSSIDIRVNIIKAKLVDIIKILDQEKIAYDVSRYSPYAIRLHDAINPKHDLVKNGLIEFQDESSQLAALLLNPKRGSMVVDFCAGSGGKSLIFGMLMRDNGRIYAFDTNMRRLNNLTPRLEKSGLKNVYPEVISNENDAKVKRFYNKIDYVFVDAPCSGIGTLRRNPELKFNINAKKLEELNKIQSTILDAAGKLLKKGGQLVYATCSILQEENQDIISTFLRYNPNFAIINANTVLKSCENIINSDGCLEILPNTDCGDGFFAVKLIRNS